MPKLTKLSVETLQPAKVRREIPDSLMTGLYLVIQPSAVKSWAIRYRLHGRPAKYTLGKFPGLSLKDARIEAAAKLRLVAEGTDPSLEKRRRDDAVSTLVESYLSDVEDDLRPATVRNYKLMLKNELVPSVGKRRIGDVRKVDIAAILTAIRQRGAKAMARQTLGAFKSFFTWCIDQGLIEDSPCRNLKTGTFESRDRALSDDELRVVWQAATNRGGPFGAAVKLLVLTGQRCNEVCRMERTELDTEGRLWRLPGSRSKNKQPNEIPLCAEALAILSDIPKIGDQYVFTLSGKKPINGFAVAKKLLDKEAAKINGAPLTPWRLHDLRRTFSTGLAAMGITQPVTESLLNHQSGMVSGIAGIYNKYDYKKEKAVAAEAWGGRVRSIVSGKGASNILPMVRP